MAKPPGETEKEESPTSRAKVLINKADPGTGERKDVLASDPPPKTPAPEIDHAFTLRKNIYDEIDDHDGEIEIESQELVNLLEQILKKYSIYGSLKTLKSPYEPLIFNLEKLEEATKKDPIDEKDRLACSDLRLLLDTISKGSGDLKLDKYFKTRNSNREQKLVTFETLWKLFPSGSLVFGKPFLGQDQVCLVYDNIRPWPDSESSKQWTLVCWAYDGDGKSFKRIALNLQIKHFEASKPIMTLPYYPLEFHEQYEKVKKELITREKQYRECCTEQESRMYYYNDEAIFTKRGFSRLKNTMRLLFPKPITS